MSSTIWQCDLEGKEIQQFQEIIDHKKGHAIAIDNGYELVNRHTKQKKTTDRWKLLVEFADETTAWLPLKDMKEGNPVELAKYAGLDKIHFEPAFNWWVHHVHY
jgi:hypothetical protein